MAEEQGGRRWWLVLIASPLQGHMTPMLQLATYLHSKGFSITIAHSEFNRPDPSKHPDFVFFPLSGNLSTPSISAGIIQFLQALSENFKPRLKEHLIQIINTQKEKETVVIIYDNLMFFAGDVANELGLPSMILRSCSAAFFPAYEIIPWLHQEGRFRNRKRNMAEEQGGRWWRLVLIASPLQGHIHDSHASAWHLPSFQRHLHNHSSLGI